MTGRLTTTAHKQLKILDTLGLVRCERAGRSEPVYGSEDQMLESHVTVVFPPPLYRPWRRSERAKTGQ